MARTRARVQNEDRNHKAVVIERRRDDEDDDAIESGRKDRPTPSARDSKQAPTGIIGRIPVVRGIAAYIKGVVSEIQKVTWPTRDELQRLTLIVLGVTAAFAIGLGILTTFYSWWFQQAFHADSEWIFLAVAGAVAVVSGGAYWAFRKQL